MLAAVAVAWITVRRCWQVAAIVLGSTAIAIPVAAIVVVPTAGVIEMETDGLGQNRTGSRRFHPVTLERMRGNRGVVSALRRVAA